MKTVFGCLALLMVWGTLAQTPDVRSLLIESGSMCVMLDARGNIRTLNSRAGVEFATPHVCCIPFVATLTDVGDVPNTYECLAADAKTVRCEAVPNGWRFSYSDFKSGLLKSAAYTVTARPDDRRIRWNIELEPAEGRAITEYAFPRFPIANRIGAVGGDDAFVSGRNKGGQ